ncbi:hypothetical protein HDV01_007504 [Terramyces sp. JEL0728]|nr:hypothetical protein HDV01_007504 [Terramyces sp. JEL0728]
MYSLLFSALAPLASAYSLCDPANYPYSGQSVANVPFLNLFKAQNIVVNGQSVPVTVSGSVSIVDGCTFATNQLSFSGPASIEFVGRKASDWFGTSAVLLSTLQVDASSLPSSQSYKLISTPGNSVSYNDFDVIELYDPVSGVIIGSATLPGKNSVPVTTTIPPAATTDAVTTTKANAAPVNVVATTAAPVTTSKTSDASKLMIGGLTALLLCMATMF